MSVNYGRLDLWAKPVKKRTKHNLLQRRADLITVVFAVVLLVGISVLSYHLMEKPILRIKDRIAGEANQLDPVLRTAASSVDNSTLVAGTSKTP
jgi:peptidoglycan/LPS O-acetylase OafA/YrhL